ncbi:metallophosphatase [Dokdonia sp.]|uniref:metallophosphatase n=1 Tax=Dokdonia sp. TaxID=2024995 RepID=UPI003265CBEB
MNLKNHIHKVLFCLILCITSYTYSQEKEVSVYITGNTNTPGAETTLQNIVDDASEESMLLLLGNATPKTGFNDQAKPSIDQQLKTTSSFKGKVIFTSGNNEWQDRGYKGVKAFEKYIQKNSDAKFYPDKGCPIKKTDLSDNAVLITIDSQWFLENWDKQTYLNEDCDIKNRNDFFLEFESLLKKSQTKTKIIAIHHPMLSLSKAGFFARTGGFSQEDFQHTQYRSLRNRLLTLAQENERILFVSGSDKNLQYINDFGVPQIVSGAAGETKKVQKVATGSGNFALSEKGYTRLDIGANGSVTVHFKNQTGVLFTTTLFKEIEQTASITLEPKNTYPENKKASVYSNDETKKSKVYKGLWGDHYREFYSKEVNAPVAFLDTLKGGLTPVRAGGGHQSKSLRLEDKNGKEYVMRALRKSAIKFLQSTAFKDTYVEEDLEGSFADTFLLDFYTTAHPYTATTIGTLSDAADVYHTNPALYYIPKQEALGTYNADYGDELYLIEERVSSSHKDLKSFGTPDKILSTSDVLQEIHKTGKEIVDEPSYIRARLFDMLIGDWDRHEDQWRWALFKNADGSEICKPIPRDRDQAFSVFDGSLLAFLRFAVPSIRMMQSFDEELKSPSWFSFEPYPLDMAFINQSNWQDWEKEAMALQNGITDEVIENAFTHLPEEVKGQTIEEIKGKLKGRRGNIVSIAKKYYDFINKHEVITGTQKGDTFEITRLPDGKTTIDINRKDVGIFHRTFSSDETKEIWIYGLDGKDTFKVTGKGDRLIKIKVMGGKKNDTYDFENTKKIKIYDYKGKENTILNNASKKWLVDSYEINNYDYKKRKYSVNQFLPIIGSNPDDGFRIGFVNNFTTYGIQRNPFTTKHTISASYYTGNSGYDASYNGEFANIFHNWNFGIELKYNSPNFAQNFFGFGNSTEYDKDLVDLDFNRVRIRQLKGALALIWRGNNGGYFKIKPLIESFEVENTSDRFIATPGIGGVNVLTFESQTYAGGEVSYGFKNKDNVAFPTYGFDTEITAGYKAIVDGGNDDNKFGYVASHIAFDYKISKNGNLVFATKLGGEAILGDNFEFFHGASLGGNHSLRGFRNERFIGKYAFYQNTDLRLKLGKFKSSFIPLSYGVTGGFDYGRVWEGNETSNIINESETINTSAGGSFWISGLDTFTANVGYYGSDDGGRIVFVLGFAF